MSQDLKEPLADLVREVPRHVAKPDLADMAWAAGRRRRRTRRTAFAAAAAFAAVVLAGTAPGLLGALGMDRDVPFANGSGVAVDGYPQRIGHSWWIRDLPDAPGPVAAVMESDYGLRDDHAWLAIAADGRQWRIPHDLRGGVHPTVSNTGRYLGYLAGEAGPYVIHDLVTGARTRFEEVGGPTEETTPYITFPEQPSHWAPDDSRVLISASTTKKPYRGRSLVLGVDGSSDLIGDYRGFPAGWLDTDRILRWEPTEDARYRTTAVTAVTMTPEGTVLERQPLALPGRLAQGVHQWSGALSPDRTTIALTTETVSMDGVVLRFDLDDGALLDRTVVPRMDGFCQYGWAGPDPVVPVVNGIESQQTSLHLANGSRTPVVVTDPVLDAGCLTLASAAVAGEPHGPLGTWTGWWTWWWREVLLGVVAVVVAARMLVSVVRRRRST
jgi:hypothetical protein